jgi:hypothetical protein
VWHGAIGFACALTIAFHRAFADYRLLWDDVEAQARDSRDVLDLKKELMKEMQWAMTTYTQVWLGLTAIFGVSMTILFRAGNINDGDLRATAIQMSLGFGACISVAYWGGFSIALDTLFYARRHWQTVAEPRVAADDDIYIDLYGE